MRKNLHILYKIIINQLTNKDTHNIPIPTPTTVKKC